MSPNVGNFVHDLVEMAKATERLPEIEAEVRDLTARNEALQKHNQGLEENILTYKSEIDRHLATIRDLEVARDDAEFRFLELDEKCGKLHTKALDLQAGIEDLVKGLNETMPQPEPEAPARPLASASSEQPRPKDGSKDGGDWANGDNHHPKTASSGQSETLPTASSPDGSGSQPKIAPFDNVEKQESASTATEALPPYTNKFYIDVPGYISRANWLEGGGTDESYDYRSPIIA